MKYLMNKTKFIFLFILSISFLGCEEDDEANLPEVVAGFTFIQSETTGTVTFTNISEEAQRYEWNFGDGTTSTEINPIRTFAEGTFTVSLKASNIAGASNVFEDQITVDIPDTMPDFDSGLLTNGDFEAGGDSWTGNALNVQTEGGNSFNLANVETAGNAFDVNLSQVVAITQDTNYILTFDASSDQARTMLAGIGLNEAPFTNTTVEIDLTTDTQTFTLQLSAADFGGANSRVLFDMGADVGVVVIDNVSLVEGGDGSDSNTGGNGFDSGLLTNGDFENGSEPWIGNAVNVQEDSGNSFNFADVQTAGDAFAVNLSQVVAITQGTNYILTFDASSDQARTMLAGIGLNEAPFTNTAPEVNLTMDTQTFTLQLSAADFGGANSRVLFDMGAAVGTVVIDNVSLVEGGDGSDTNGGGGTFDSGLLTNGDFENGATPWIGNALNVQTEGGNSFNFADVQTAGDAFAVNLSQVVAITQGTNYILTFDASSDQTRTMLAGIGLNEAPFTNTAPEVNLTTDTQTFTLQLSAADFGGANSRVLFDMGAAVGTVVIDNVSLVEGGDGSDTNGGGGTFDSGLLTNGDFENGATPWIGNALNVQTEGGNSFNFADVQTAGDAFAVNLSQVVAITQGTNYILTFDASSDQARTMLAGIGLNEAPFTNTAPEVNLTTDTQTFTLQLAANDFGGANSRVLFDMGAAVGTVVIDNVSLVEGGDGSDTNGGGSTSGELATNGDFETGDATGYDVFQNGGSATLDNTINNGGTWSGRIATNGPSNPAFKQERIGSGTVQAGDVVQIVFDHIGSVVQPGAVFNVLLFGEGATGVSFTHVFNPAPSLSSSWTTFTGTFTIPSGTDVSEGISFLIEGVCGGDTGCSVIANIDNISVTLNP
ncbi:carbohydrate binding domain-containing protein [uncultured Croceitalea sp.]|uniref:carbohydrate binding domain-containing protein n=1 Tax=uncultured Croceitalea sp. TaxID=1798908 RepID=UPI00374EBD5D